MGNTGDSCENFCQLRNASVSGRSPVGSPVLAATTRANRSGCSPTSRRPMSPPQSWQTSVMPDRSRSSNSASRIHSTWRA